MQYLYFNKQYCPMFYIGNNEINMLPPNEKLLESTIFCHNLLW